MKEILKQYGINDFTIEPLGNGLINSTWLVGTCLSASSIDGIRHKANSYVLQKINNAIFTQPQNIADNIRLVNVYLKENYPNYLFVAPLLTTSGNSIIKFNNEYFRLFPFVKNSKTIDVVETPEQAFEAAKQFAKFTKLLYGLDVNSLKITLPNFHNLKLRVEEFDAAILNGNAERITEAKDLIWFLSTQKNILSEFNTLKNNFKIRVTHHDTKISNVLFDENNNGLCVIDLDTVMPGYFISDVGDMMRTYLCPVSEEESDFNKIVIRPAFYKAIVTGYLSEMGDELNDTEKKSLLFAGKFMIYMQALRFLTDYLNDDIYYGCKYATQNFVRAGNQAVLLKKFIEFGEL